MENKQTQIEEPQGKWEIETAIIEDNKTEELLLQAAMMDISDLKIRRFTKRASFEKAVREGYRPKILLTDLMLPDTNGIEILDTLERLFDRDRLYVLVISAQQDMEVFRQVQDRGFLNYLVKSHGTIDNVRIMIKRLKALVRFQEAHPGEELS